MILTLRHQLEIDRFLRRCSGNLLKREEIVQYQELLEIDLFPADIKQRFSPGQHLF
jgi:hypothetical protein